ncbi:MAG TPA: DEAD/DEAH box helicase [Acidimicrobiia bacterium]|nr:DEAD/DEAH box helicase [Acidimicrobiia bacterium]
MTPDETPPSSDDSSSGSTVGPQDPAGTAAGGFAPPVRTWFETTFAEATAAQRDGWPAISDGRHTLVLAPTGSGKTLAAFLSAIDRLGREPVPARQARTRVVYISPLKALASDVEKNLRAPITGAAEAATRLGVAFHQPTVALRTGDTPARDRQRLVRRPPDILITTPESLYLMLTSRARETLRSVEVVIVDEIHSVAGNKRGAHLSLSLERLDDLADNPPQRIGLSATQRPLATVARFLGGYDRNGAPRPVTIVDAGTAKPLDVRIEVPVDDLAAIASMPHPPGGPASGHADRTTSSIWPHVHPRILELIEAHDTTIIFANSRRLAERLAGRLNELAGRGPESGLAPLVKAHHGSLSHEQRVIAEDELKTGALAAIVATSSLELGIDMGTVDLVVQVESPGSAARGLQRIGRAGHRVGEPSHGTIFPKHRGDLLEAAVVVRQMRDGIVEETRLPTNPLDVLAQHIVAMSAMDDWGVDEMAALVRRSANYADLSDDAFLAVLDLLAGRYPSDQFSGLAPRVIWDRTTGRIRPRDSAQRLAVTNAGTIADRGLFGVFLSDGTRVGELDEEMVYESRPGETFLLGASTWRITEITRDRVVVNPAPGEPGRMPFWHGDRPGRPIELGRALGAAVREIHALDPAEALDTLRDRYSLDARAAANLLAYLREQADATGSLPDDRTVVVERFADEIGDWRICILSPFGSRVHAPWALALEARLASRFDLDVQVLWSDDGIVVRLPDAAESVPVEDLLIDPAEVEDLVVDRLPATALFAARFREAAARALLLPRRRPGRRTALWQQRQRAADLLEIASRHPSFPVLAETTRECLRDVFDLPALCDVLARLRRGSIQVVAVDTPRASPFAQSLLFGWIAAYMYEGDTPLAERRAGALTLDRDLLTDLLGADELRELIDPEAIADLELALQRLDVDWHPARGPDDIHDLVRDLGDLTDDEIAARAQTAVGAWIETLISEHRVIRLDIDGETRVIAAEDAARYRDALGAEIPGDLPAVFVEPVADPIGDLVARYARTHPPFTVREVATRFGISTGSVEPVLARLAEETRVVRGEFRPGGVSEEWCNVQVLQRLRRGSLARLRREVEPVEPAVYARFLTAWQGARDPDRPHGSLPDALARLQGTPIVASTLEADLLCARVANFLPGALDELASTGQLVWVGAGPLGSYDGRVVLAFRDQAPLLIADPEGDAPKGPVHDAIRTQLSDDGASFWADLVGAAGTSVAEDELVGALWDLVWAGEVTNDTLAPLRARLAMRTARRRRTPPTTGARRPRPRPGRLTRAGPPAGAGRWSLVSALLTPRPGSTERAHAIATQLLDRHGIVTREAVRAEGIPGGFAAVYPVLRALEEGGRIRRGYFVSGLGAAQFALPGAVDRLRSQRGESGAPVVLAATDPAQPYGAALAWPDITTGAPRSTRTAGAFVVLIDGRPAVYLDRGGRGLTTFTESDEWITPLATLVANGRLAKLDVHTIDGRAVRESPFAAALRDAGFRDAYRGLVLRAEGAALQR